MSECKRHRPGVLRSGAQRKSTIGGIPGSSWGVWEVLRCTNCGEDRGGRWAKGLNAPTARAALEQYAAAQQAEKPKRTRRTKESLAPKVTGALPANGWPFPVSAHSEGPR